MIVWCAEIATYNDGEQCRGVFSSAEKVAEWFKNWLETEGYFVAEMPKPEHEREDRFELSMKFPETEYSERNTAFVVANKTTLDDVDTFGWN